MTFADRITAVGEVSSQLFLERRSLATTVGCTATVNIADLAWRLPQLEAIAERGERHRHARGRRLNANWLESISTGTYRSYIRTGTTGAKRLDLPLVSQGATPIDLIRRPAINSNENIANAPVFGQRYFAQASLRILLVRPRG